MKKYQDFSSVMGAIILLFYGVILSFSVITDLKWGISIFYLLYALTHAISFIFYRKEKEFSNLFLFIIGILFFVISIYGNFLNEPRIFSMFILGWTLLVSLVKLKKADYFHDRKNKLWLVEMTCLVLFLISEILFCIQLDNDREIVMVLLGYSIYTVGIFELLEAILIFVTKGKIK